MTPGRLLASLSQMGRLPKEWRVPAAFALLSVGTLVYDAAHAWFWQRAHDVAPVAAAMILVLVGLLLLRRSRFAWWVFVVFAGGGLMTWVAHLRSLTAGWIVGGLLGLVEFGLLVSPPMRR